MFISFGNFDNNSIKLQVRLFEINTIKTPNCNPAGEFFTGIVDTGATMTSISTRIAEKLQFTPAETKIPTNTANGKVFNYCYPVQFVLYNHDNKLWQATNMIVSSFLSDEIDVLIGMDIISKGHLTITPDNRYCFTL